MNYDIINSYLCTIKECILAFIFPIANQQKYRTLHDIATKFVSDENHVNEKIKTEHSKVSGAELTYFYGYLNKSTFIYNALFVFTFVTSILIVVKITITCRKLYRMKMSAMTDKQVINSLKLSNVKLNDSVSEVKPKLNSGDTTRKINKTNQIVDHPIITRDKSSAKHGCIGMKNAILGVIQQVPMSESLNPPCNARRTLEVANNIRSNKSSVNQSTQCVGVNSNNDLEINEKVGYNCQTEKENDGDDKMGGYEAQLLNDIDRRLQGQKSDTTNKSTFHKLSQTECWSNFNGSRTSPTKTNTDHNNSVSNKNVSCELTDNNICQENKITKQNSNVALSHGEESDNMNSSSSDSDISNTPTKEPAKKLKSILRVYQKNLQSSSTPVQADCKDSNIEHRVHFNLPCRSEEGLEQEEDYDDHMDSEYSSSGDDFAVALDADNLFANTDSTKYSYGSLVPRVHNKRKFSLLADEDDDDIVFCDDWSEREQKRRDREIKDANCRQYNDVKSANSASDIVAGKLPDFKNDQSVYLNSNCIDEFHRLQITMDMHKPLTNSGTAQRTRIDESFTKWVAGDMSDVCSRTCYNHTGNISTPCRPSDTKEVTKLIVNNQSCGDGIPCMETSMTINNVVNHDNNSSESKPVDQSASHVNEHVDTSNETAHGQTAKTVDVLQEVLTVDQPQVCDMTLSSLEDMATDAFSNIIDEVRRTTSCSPCNHGNEAVNDITAMKRVTGNSVNTTQCKRFISKNHKEDDSDAVSEKETVISDDNESISANKKEIPNLVSCNRGIEVLSNEVSVGEDSKSKLDIDIKVKLVQHKSSSDSKIEYVVRDRTPSPDSKYTFELMSDRDNTFDGISEFSEYIPDKRV